MELQIKTPVQIVQELIAIHATRIEAGERLQANGLTGDIAARLHSAREQSRQFTAELMDELSNFGDAVQADVNRENDYLAIWEKALPNLESMNAAEAVQTFENMENKLKQTYEQYLDTEVELPVSVQELLIKQAGALT